MDAGWWSQHIPEREVGKFKQTCGEDVFELGACNISQDSLLMRIY